MAFVQVHHVKYTVGDLDRSVAFYCNLLGFELTYRATRENLPSYDAIMDMENVKVRVGMLRHPPTGFTLGLVQFLNPEPVARPLRNNYIGASSLALQVESAETEYERLTAAGVPAISRHQPAHRNRAQRQKGGRRLLHPGPGRHPHRTLAAGRGISAFFRPDCQN